MKKKLGFLLIALLIVNISVIFTTFVIAKAEKVKQDEFDFPKVSSPPISAAKDTYANSYHPTENFGGENLLYAGIYLTGSDYCDAFFYFPLTSVPSEWTKAEISLSIWSVDATINFTVYLIEENWEELGLTYLNEPSFGPVITNLIVSADTFYKIDVSSLINGRNSISICLHCDPKNYVDEYVLIDSREDLSFIYRPQIIWDNVYGEISVESPDKSDSWESGEHTIEWESYGAVSDRVDIKLYKGNDFIEDIDTYVENKGKYDWKINTYDNYNGNDYKIKIVDFDNEDVYGYSDKFEINYRTLDFTIIIGIIIVASIAGGIVVTILVLRKFLISRNAGQKSPEEKQVLPVEKQIETKQMDTKKCQRCGAVSRLGSSFCESCGNKLTNKS